MDAAAAAFTRTGILRVGQPVAFQRLVGQAPNATITPPGGAIVTAAVRSYLPDTTQQAASGYSASQVGNLTEGDRQVLVMAQDLAAAGFPLPLMKGDRIVLQAADEPVPVGEVLTVTRVDAQKRKMAGCVEVYGLGVA